MATIHDAYLNALLADASYVNGLSTELSGDNLSSALADRMTPSLASYIGRNFRIVAQTAVTSSSFDATVWRDTEGRILVSIRGTQGLVDIFADLDLATTGLAHKQLAEMVNWWLRISTPERSAGGTPQYVSQIRVTSENNFQMDTAVLETGEVADYRIIESVNGRSLGGYSASAFLRAGADHGRGSRAPPHDGA